MDSEKTFKTKTGFCHILPDKIVLTRDGIIGNVSEVVVGNNMSRVIIIYSLLSIFLLYSAFSGFQKGQNIQSILFGLLALYLIYGIIASLNNSATPIIARNKVKDVKFKKAILGLTRSRFEVIFEDDNGKNRKRLIMLPGSTNDGENETKKAVNILMEEKLLSE